MSALSKVTAFLGLLLPALIASCGTGGAPFQQLEGNEITIREGAHQFHGNRPLIRVNFGGGVKYALADTGCTTTLLVIDEKTFAEKARTMPKERIGSVSGSVDGISTKLRINGTVISALAVSSKQVPWGKDYQILLGLNALHRFQVGFDFIESRAIWREVNSRMMSTDLLVLRDLLKDHLFVIDTGATKSVFLKSGRTFDVSSFERPLIDLREIARMSPRSLSGAVSRGVPKIVLLGVSDLPQIGQLELSKVLRMSSRR